MVSPHHFVVWYALMGGHLVPLPLPMHAGTMAITLLIAEKKMGEITTKDDEDLLPPGGHYGHNDRETGVMRDEGSGGTRTTDRAGVLVGRGRGPGVVSAGTKILSDRRHGAQLA
ncbi:hypothetical protein Bbelb_412920 [Branchiostoma belcheri]|nr:hypothetical protein Bbelb_412920 [Branchiostoma belcheri]